MEGKNSILNLEPKLVTYHSKCCHKLSKKSNAIVITVPCHNCDNNFGEIQTMSQVVQGTVMTTRIFMRNPPAGRTDWHVRIQTGLMTCDIY